MSVKISDLNPLIRELAIQRTRTQHPDRPVDYILDSKLIASFSWENTPEGVPAWGTLSQATSPQDLKQREKQFIKDYINSPTITPKLNRAGQRYILKEPLGIFPVDSDLTLCYDDGSSICGFCFTKDYKEPGFFHKEDFLKATCPIFYVPMKNLVPWAEESTPKSKEFPERWYVKLEFPHSTNYPFLVHWRGTPWVGEGFMKYDKQWLPPKTEVKPEHIITYKEFCDKYYPESSAFVPLSGFKIGDHVEYYRHATLEEWETINNSPVLNTDSLLRKTGYVSDAGGAGIQFDECCFRFPPACFRLVQQESKPSAEKFKLLDVRFGSNMELSYRLDVHDPSVIPKTGEFISRQEDPTIFPDIKLPKLPGNFVSFDDD